MIESRKEKVTKTVVINAILLSLSILCLVPFIIVISVSLTSEADILKYGYNLIPKKIDLTAYSYVFKNAATLIQSYKITVIVTAIFTFLNVLLNAMCAYPLSRSNFKFKKQFTFYIFFTMLFSGGLVPSYILIKKYLHMQDTIWVMIIPGLAAPFFIMMFKTFFKKVPESIFESAKIDGANEFRIFFTMVLPLSKPVLATIALFSLLGKWNDWYTALLYISDEKLYPLQYLLQRILMDLAFVVEHMDKLPGFVTDKVQNIPGEGIRMAMCLLAAGPMLVIFPFFQKYFVKGMTVGSVKG